MLDNDPAPDREPRGADRWILLGAVVLAIGFFIGIVLEDYQPAKLVPLFVLCAWFPLIALHESGHAVMARLFGWHVEEIVVGFGRPIWRGRLFGAPFTIKLYPLGGFMRPAPPHLRYVRLASAMVYLAGPGVELLVLGALWIAIGARLFTPQEDIPTLIAQGVAIAVSISAISNLLPRTVQTDHGPSVTDGMGAFFAFVRPSEHFVAQVLRTYAVRIAGAADVTAAIRTCEEAYAALPDEPQVQELVRDVLRDLSHDPEQRSEVRAALRESRLPRELVQRFDGSTV